MIKWLAEWAGELVVGVLVCIAIFPVIRIGSQIRTARTLKRRGYRGDQLRRSERYAAFGVVLALAAGIALGIFVPGRWWILYTFVVGLLILLGYLGFVLVPEGLGD